MNFTAHIQRIIHPRTDTPEAAWKAAANSTYASAILAANRMLFGGLLLFTPLPIKQGLAHLGVGFVYTILACLAYRRSRLASTVIMVLTVLEAMIEMSLAPGYRVNFFIIAVAFVLAVGGLRGANAVFAHHRKSRP